MITCEREEKHQSEIEHGLNPRKRRKEMRRVRIRNKPDLKDNSPGRLSWRTSAC